MLHAGARLVHLGRRRKLSPTRQELLQTRLPQLRILPQGADVAPGTLDPFALPAFGTRREQSSPPGRTPAPPAVWLEIGFGAGEHLLHQARQQREYLHLGCEAYAAGIARLLADMEKPENRGIDNLRLHDGDAAQLLRALKDASIARIHLLFPDPWPKRRHHKRRMARLEMLRAMQRVLADDGELRIATDSGEYAGWILANMRQCRELCWQARRAQDWRNPPEAHPPTRYEQKARRAGRQVIHLQFQRLARALP